MRQWKTMADFGREITEMDELNPRSEKKELGISHASKVASNIVKLYRIGGKKKVIEDILKVLPREDGYNRFFFTTDQLVRVDKIVRKLFRWHWWPWSAIRKNMRRLA